MPAAAWRSPGSTDSDPTQTSVRGRRGAVGSRPHAGAWLSGLLAVVALFALALPALAVPPSLTEISKYTIVAMRGGGTVLQLSNSELGADRQVLSTSTDAACGGSGYPNLVSIFGTRWNTGTNPDSLNDAAPLFQGTNWSGEVALTSSTGEFQLANSFLFAVTGIQGAAANPIDSISNSTYFADGVNCPGGVPAGTNLTSTGVRGGQSFAPLLADLGTWKAFILGLTGEATINSTAGYQNVTATGGAGGRRDTFADALDTNGDGVIVVDVDVDGDFALNNLDWVIDGTGNKLIIFRLLNGSNMKMDNVSIILGDGGIANLGIAAIFFSGYESPGSGDTVIEAGSNNVANGIGFWDLNTVGEGGNTKIVFNNGQGCGQFITQSLTFSNNRWVLCAPAELPGEVTIAKSDPVIAPAGPNQYTATYTLTVTNTGGAPATYTLFDTPGFPGTGVTLNSMNAATGNGTLLPATFPIANPPNNTQQQVSAADVALAAAEVDTYTVVITFTVSPTATNLACVNTTANNGAFNAANITGTSTASDTGCANIPLVTIAKGDPQIAPTGSPNQFTATYTLTVTNAGGAAATYTLFDTPAFPTTGVTLNSLNASTATGSLLPATFPIANPPNNTQQQISTAGVALAVAEVDTYTLVITFTVAAEATNLACVSTTANNGAFNTASITGTSTASDTGCGNISTVTIVKSDPVIALVGANQYTATYTLTVTNTSAGAATYTLFDTPGFPGTGVTLNELNVTGTTGGSINAGFPIANPTNNQQYQISTAAVALAAAEVDSYTVVITFTTSPTATNLACVSTTANNGAFNAASITGTSTASDTGCANIPLVTIVKSDAVIAPVGANQFTATYLLTVTNAGAAAATYTLFDTPGFPATVTLDQLNVTGTTGGSINAGFPIANPTNNTPVQISTAAVALAVAEVDTYTVVITFTTSPSSTNLTCASTTANNGAFNAASITGSSTASDTGCTDIPLVTIVKSDPVIALLGPNQYTATYTLTVTNSSDAAATYTLYDTPAFPGTGVTLNSLDATTATGSLGGPAFPRANPGNGVQQQISADPVGLVAGEVDTYTVVITFTVSPTATNLACVNTTANNGAFNTASITGSSSASDTGCGNIPLVTIAKSDPVVAPVGPNQFTATYTLTVTNAGAAAATYTLFDTPAFPPGVTLNSLNATTATGTLLAGAFPPPVANPPNNTQQQISAAAVALAVAEIDTYTVVVTFTVSPTATNLACVSTTANNGAFNTASITGSSTASDTGCGNIPLVTIVKSNPVIAPQGGNQFVATYTVTVTNAGGAAAVYTLFDTPAFPPGVTLDSMNATTVGGDVIDGVYPLALPVNGAQQQVSESDFALPVGAVDTYTLTIAFTVSEQATNLNCVSTTENNGAFNTGSITGTSTASDTGCGDIVLEPESVPVPTLGEMALLALMLLLASLGGLYARRARGD